MPLPPAVVLDVSPEVGPELASAAQSGCDRALGPGRCLLGEPAGAIGREASWVATLRHLHGPPARLRIELRTLVPPGVLVVARDLEFQSSDPDSERWATAGVVVAALVMDAESKAAVARAVAPKPPPPRAPATGLSSPARRSPPPSRYQVEARSRGAGIRALSVDLAALVGPGLEPGLWRLGAELRASVGWAGLPLGGWVSVRGSRRSGTVEAAWYSGHAGAVLGLGSGLDLFAIDLRAGGGVTRLEVWAKEDGRQAEATEWRLGGVSALDLVLNTGSQLGAVATLEATASWPRLVVVNHGLVIGRQPVVEWAVLCGLRWVTAASPGAQGKDNSRQLGALRPDGTGRSAQARAW